MKKIFLILVIALPYTAIFSQIKDSTYSHKTLPFHIDDSKKMPDFELEEKKQGTFITGIPRFEFDPIRGFGIGGNINLFINKDKNDPFFDYTPYRQRLNAEFFIYENGRVKYALNYDAPYIFDTKWRMRADVVLWEDPDAQYWGVGRNTLNPLNFRDKKNGGMRTFNKIKAYEDNLSIAELAADGNYYTDHHFNTMRHREQLFNLLAERTYMGGRLRLLFGYEALFTNFQSYNGKIADEAFLSNGTAVDAINSPTLVDLQIADGTWDRYNLTGFRNDNSFMFTSMLAAALMYDTRDFEPDPSKGVFLQYSHEYSAPWIGSQFNFNKFMMQGQYITTLMRWRNNKSRLTFAGMGAFGHIFGNRINFIEMWDLSSQAEAGGILVLGEIGRAHV